MSSSRPNFTNPLIINLGFHSITTHTSNTYPSIIARPHRQLVELISTEHNRVTDKGQLGVERIGERGVVTNFGVVR